MYYAKLAIDAQVAQMWVLTKYRNYLPATKNQNLKGIKQLDGVC